MREPAVSPVSLPVKKIQFQKWLNLVISHVFFTFYVHLIHSFWMLSFVCWCGKKWEARLVSKIVGIILLSSWWYLGNECFNERELFFFLNIFVPEERWEPVEWRNERCGNAAIVFFVLGNLLICLVCILSSGNHWTFFFYSQNNNISIGGNSWQNGASKQQHS